MNKLLEIRNLRVQFSIGRKRFTAVDGVNLYVCPGETVILAGESGSGKTITALSVCRILPANAHLSCASINFSGQDLSLLDESSLNKFRGRDIAYIFQEPTSYLNPVYTIGNQICESIILHQRKDKNSARKYALDLLRAVNITEPERVFNSYPHQLSGGMNQRVFIAMSLSSNPKLLIADEPTTSLDVTIELQILDLLSRLKKELGFSLLFITHNLSIAKKIADRIYVMYRGKIVEEAKKEDLFLHQEHFHTKELIAAYERIGHL